MNPYREAFYSRQANWHQYHDAQEVLAKHQRREKYYRWYTQGWLPEAADTSIVDVACGAGQFVHFLQSSGYQDAVGVDLDESQIELARQLGLNCHCRPALQFLQTNSTKYDVIAVIDFLEHLNLDELYTFMQAAVLCLRRNGRIIGSVPNAESPMGFGTRHSDITHELAFSSTSLNELVFCHGLEELEVRDPYPAPVDGVRRIYRLMCRSMRVVEALRLRSLGLRPPRIWSPVIWFTARMPE